MDTDTNPIEVLRREGCRLQALIEAAYALAGTDGPSGRGASAEELTADLLALADGRAGTRISGTETSGQSVGPVAFGKRPAGSTFLTDPLAPVYQALIRSWIGPTPRASRGDELQDVALVEKARSALEPTLLTFCIDGRLSRSALLKGLPDHLSKIARTRPLALLRAERQIRNTARSAQVMRERLEHDLVAIAGQFGLRDTTVHAVTPALSDPHHGHQTVARVTFADGVEVYYKPRDVSDHVALLGIHRALSRPGDGVPPEAPAVLARDGYGWVLGVEARTGDSSPRDGAAASDHPDYWRAAGRLLGLAFLCRMTDLHFDNVISTTERPVIIDPECIQTPGPAPHFPGADIASWFGDSVLSTGLIDVRIPVRPGPDLSGLARLPGSPGLPTGGPPIPYDYRNGRFLLRSGPAKSAGATGAGGLIGPHHDLWRRHHDALAEGLAGLLNDARRGATRRAILHATRGVRLGRLVVRPTSFYATLLQSCAAPGLQGSADVLASHLLGCLAVAPLHALVASSPQLARRVRFAELAQLLDGDVPLFHLELRTGRLVCQDLPLGQVTRSEGRLRGVPGIRAVTESTMRPQRLSLRVAALRGEVLLAPRRGHLTTDPEGSEPTPDLIELARSRVAEVADEIERFGCETLPMLSFERPHPKADYIEPVSPGLGLYSGLSGMALTLAAFGADGGHERLLHLAGQLLRGGRSAAGIARDPSLQSLGLEGLGGYLGAFLEVRRLDPTRARGWDVRWLAQRVVRAAGTSPPSRNCDLMQGDAGLLCALRRLDETDGASRAVVQAAETLGDRILGRRRPILALPGLWTTIRPRSICLGAAHGSAGICLGLASAYALTGRSRFRDVATETLATLEQFALRPGAVTSRLGGLSIDRRANNGSWCHGRCGILACRAATGHLLGLSTPPTPFEDWADDAWPPDDSFCCGAAGWLSLASAGRVRPAPGLKKRLVDRLRTRRVAEGRVEMPWAFRMGLFKGVTGFCLAALLAENPGVIANPLLGWS